MKKIIIYCCIPLIIGTFIGFFINLLCPIKVRWCIFLISATIIIGFTLNLIRIYVFKDTLSTDNAIQNKHLKMINYKLFGCYAIALLCIPGFLVILLTITLEDNVVDIILLVIGTIFSYSLYEGNKIELKKIELEDKYSEQI